MTPVADDHDRTAAAGALVQIEGLQTHFATDDGLVRAVDGLSLSLPRGRTLCVVGESGCGKSITARSVLGLVDPPGRVVDGHIWWHGDGGDPIDLVSLDPKSEELRRFRGKEIAMVFQEPMASLSPMYTVAEHLVEAVRLHLPMSKKDAYEHGLSLLKRVGIPYPENRMDSYSWQLSGGMCQRVMIAIALACRPKLLIADEPTTALDVTTQARILDLLAELQEETGMAMMFITHDLGVVAEIADEVAVMYLGTLVEQGPVDDIFHQPKHPYTKALLESIPTMGATRQRLPSIRGQVPHPLSRPPGCPFHNRCDQMITGLCDVQDPPTVHFGDGRLARCVLYDDQRLTEHGLGNGDPRPEDGERS